MNVTEPFTSKEIRDEGQEKSLREETLLSSVSPIGCHVKNCLTRK